MESILFSEQEIRNKTSETGNYISRKYKDKPLLIVGILKGSFVFLADLIRAIDIPCEVGFMCAESYEGTESTGEVRITLDLKQDISQYHVIIAEDIIDTGRTLKAVADILKERNPLSLEIITLLDKPSRRIADIDADISLFTIPDLFVVGYGLDYNENFRNLPYIAELR
ncbi:MAG: hypoxanthine phosphoribosyltransferase [Ruminococcus sp.]|nr:hypoxanthine phosphoribosyltransferase [Ruminococcus sp.]